MRFLKSCPKFCPIHFLWKFPHICYRGKSIPIICATSVIFIKTTQRKQSPNRRKFAQSGHPVHTLQLTLYICKHESVSAGHSRFISRREPKGTFRRPRTWWCETSREPSTTPSTGGRTTGGCAKVRMPFWSFDPTKMFRLWEKKNLPWRKAMRLDKSFDPR
jgi:hypothetical protein